MEAGDADAGVYDDEGLGPGVVADRFRGGSLSGAGTRGSRPFGTRGKAELPGRGLVEFERWRGFGIVGYGWC